MSLFIDSMGQKPVEIKCNYCDEIFDETLINVIEPKQDLRCIYCGNKIDNVLGAVSLITIKSLQLAFDSLEETINNMDKLRLE